VPTPGGEARSRRSRDPPDAGARHLAIDRGAPQPHLLDGLRRRQPGLDQLQSRCDPLRVERLTARLLALGPGGGDAFFGTLGDEPALEVRNRAEDVEAGIAQITSISGLDCAPQGVVRQP
jgi:hypothetical protein